MVFPSGDGPSCCTGGPDSVPSTAGTGTSQGKDKAQLTLLHCHATNHVVYNG